MKVYRIQRDETPDNPFGDGPYKHGVFFDHDQPHRPPPPMHITANRFRFAFASPQQLKRWFRPHHIKRMYECGFRIVTHDVPPEAIGYADACQIGIQKYSPWPLKST